MDAADFNAYLSALLDEMKVQWPGNRAVNIVCHGHSVPAGYFATPFVDPFRAYPHLLHRIIKERFPFAVVNVIVTAIGGEHSESGARRFASEALCHRPDVVLIDYALNDRRLGLEAAQKAWSLMIGQALSRGVKVILMTPSWDASYFDRNGDWEKLVGHAEQVRRLAREYRVGLADVFARFEEAVRRPEDLVALLSHVNHPSEAGHMLAALEAAKYFVAR